MNGTETLNPTTGQKEALPLSKCCRFVLLRFTVLLFPTCSRFLKKIFASRFWKVAESFGSGLLVWFCLPKINLSPEQIIGTSEGMETNQSMMNFAFSMSELEQ